MDTAAAFGAFADAVALATILLALASLACGLIFFRRRAEDPLPDSECPSMTVLKPLKGKDEDLYANLASFCGQDYPALQLIFCVDSPDDPALETARRLRREFPGRDIEVVVGTSRLGLNPKISNLANAYPQAKHETLLISDSDIRVGPDFLRRLAAGLRDPRVGLVTCFYQARGTSGLWGTLEALSINARFLPQAVMAAMLGVRFAMGAAILVRRRAFEAAGGFAALADHLADDYCLGERVRKAGWGLEFSRLVVDSITGPVTALEHLRHLVRETRTIRLCRPAGYAGMLLLHGFSLMSLKLAFLDASAWSVSLWVVALAARSLTCAALWLSASAAPPPFKALLLLPLSEWLSFGAWLLGFRSGSILWRGSRYALEPDGRLIPAPRTGVPAQAL